MSVPGQFNMESIVSMMLLSASANSHSSKSPYMAVINAVVTLMIMAVINMVRERFHEIRLAFRPVRKNITYTISGYVCFRNHGLCSVDIPIKFKSVMYELYKKLSSDPKVNIEYQVIESFAERYWNDDDEEVKKGTQIIVFKNCTDMYKLTDDIGISVILDERSNDKAGEGTYKTNQYDIVLTALNNRIETLFDFMAAVEKKYDSFIKEENLTPMVWELSSIDKDNDPVFDKVRFDTTKSFDNLFFEQKSQVIAKLDYFMNNESKYRQLGMPYTLGMLFHGEAGVGKSSCIKSIAKYTGRHIVSIPMKHIRNISHLKQIFLNDILGGSKIPTNQRLYVFEEIDCSEWKDVVTARQLKTPGVASPASSMDKFEEITAADVGGSATNIGLATLVHTLVKKNDYSVENATGSKLNLGELLELLDGVIEMPGRIIIMTSNHPEVLDPALLRPGRIDMKIEFKRLIKRDVAAMYRLWFDEDLPEQVVEKISDYRFSQADLGALFSSMDQRLIVGVLAGETS